MRRLGLGALTAGFGLYAAAFFLYAGTLGYPPVWDDVTYVFGEPFLLECGNLASVLDPRRLYSVLPVRNASRPVWLASVLLDSCASGSLPQYRVANVLYYAVCVFLVGALAWSLSRDRLLAFAAGALFLVHPLHAQVVNLISFRADVLCLGFLAGGLVMHRGADARRGLSGALWDAAAAGAFLLALLSKEMAITFPALALASERFVPPERPETAVSAGRRWTRYGVWVLIAASFLLFRASRSGYVFEGRKDVFSEWRDRFEALRAPSAEELAAFPRGPRRRVDLPPWGRVYDEPWPRLLTMSGVAGRYLARLAWPTRLQGDYNPPVITDWDDLRPWLAWLGWGLVSLAAWRLRRANPIAAFGLAWVPLSLAPVSGFVTLLNLETDHYLYVPTAGLCLAAAAGWAALARRSPAVAAALGLTLLFAGARGTVARNRDFRDERTFYRATLALDPKVSRARFNLAEVYRSEGDLDGAEVEYRMTLRSWPHYSLARNALARLLLSQGRVRESLRELDAGLRLGGDDAAFRYNRGVALRALGRRGEAAADFQRAAALQGDLWEAWLALGILRLESGQPKLAEEALFEAVSRTGWKSPLALHQLALAAGRAGSRDRARRALDALRRAEPGLARALVAGRRVEVRPALLP